MFVGYVSAKHRCDDLCELLDGLVSSIDRCNELRELLVGLIPRVDRRGELRVMSDGHDVSCGGIQLLISMPSG